jgi:hypothetical protein
LSEPINQVGLRSLHPIRSGLQEMIGGVFGGVSFNSRRGRAVS